ncbi:MAG: rRNA pseudouridine synthase [Bacteriovoracaceae bacterium]|nr:rRNA pseudouridine synthase [Bacteriovoracaceae bacterium]
MPKARPQLRLQKVMADCGVDSRRKCEQLILAGRVKVNGEIVDVLGTKVDPTFDIIEVDNETIDKDSIEKVYLLLNKPRAYMTTLSDPEGRKTIMDLIPFIKQRVFPVGRLDYLSEGLLLMTNDGDMANLIMHPRNEVIKTYEVKVFGIVNEVILNKLRAGIQMEDGFAKPKSVRVLEYLPKKTWIEFRLTEAKNRDIRRLCEAFGLTIDKLRQVAIEGLSINGINPGESQLITKRELLKSLSMNEDGTRIKDVAVKSYVSLKPSARIKNIERRKKTYDVMDADDPKHHKYRKTEYYSTLEQQKIYRAELAAKELAAKTEAVTTAATTGKQTKRTFRTPVA